MIVDDGSLKLWATERCHHSATDPNGFVSFLSSFRCFVIFKRCFNWLWYRTWMDLGETTFFLVPVHWSSKFLLQGEGIRMTMAFQRMSHYFAELKPGSLVLEAWCIVKRGGEAAKRQMGKKDPKRFAPAKETKLIGFWASTRYVFFSMRVSVATFQAVKKWQIHPKAWTCYCMACYAAQSSSPIKLRFSNYGSATTLQQPRLRNQTTLSLQQLRFGNYASATKTRSRFSNHASATKTHSLQQPNLSNQSSPPVASTCTGTSYTSYQNPTPSGKHMQSHILHVISKSHPLWQVHAKSHLTFALWIIV